MTEAIPSGRERLQFPRDANDFKRDQRYFCWSLVKFSSDIFLCQNILKFRMPLKLLRNLLIEGLPYLMNIIFDECAKSSSALQRHPLVVASNRSLAGLRRTGFKTLLHVSIAL